MIPDCISFRSIPHSSRIFLDYLAYAPDVRKFFPTSPDKEQVIARAKELPRNLERQACVAEILARQNRGWGASEKTLANIERLRNGAFAVVTGQQVGLFGGPLLSLLKAASVLALAAEAETAGVDCVPIFWMASEDHDLAEINQALLLNQNFGLEPFAAQAVGQAESPVATIRFAEGTNELVDTVANLLGDSMAADYLRESYRDGETFPSAFAKLYSRIFADYGLILIDPADPELHQLARPLFADSVSRWQELNRSLLARNSELRDAQYHEQVKVTDESTLVFALVDGVRTPVHRVNGEFLFDRQKLKADEFLHRIQAAPEEFNANVLLRPILQDYWLPTLGYIGGPAEIAYFAQTAVVYEKLLGRVTPILPRLSATVLEPRIEKLLGKYKLELTELFHGETELRDLLAVRALPAELKQRFADGRRAVEQAVSGISQSLAGLDKTLVEAAKRAASKMLYQMNRLEKRAAKAELERAEIIARHAMQIENSLYPRKTLQEREISGLYFYAKYGPELIDRLIETAQVRCPEHKIVQL